MNTVQPELLRRRTDPLVIRPVGHLNPEPSLGTVLMRTLPALPIASRLPSNRLALALPEMNQCRFAEVPFYSVFVARFSRPNNRNLWPQIADPKVHIAPELTLVNPGTNTLFL